jgi:hypothetical protein
MQLGLTLIKQPLSGPATATAEHPDATCHMSLPTSYTSRSTANERCEAAASCGRNEQALVPFQTPHINFRGSGIRGNAGIVVGSIVFGIVAISSRSHTRHVIVTVPAQDVTICQGRRRRCRTSSRTATAHTRSTANARQLPSAHPADITQLISPS